jgi:hypothetical protein
MVMVVNAWIDGARPIAPGLPVRPGDPRGRAGARRGPRPRWGA